MKTVLVFIVVVNIFCHHVSESAFFDSIFLNPGRQQKLVTIVDKDREICVVVPRQNTLKGKERYTDSNIKAYAVFPGRHNNAFSPLLLEPACRTYDIAIGLYPADFVFLKHTIFMNRSPPSFCMFSTDEFSRFTEEFWCDDTAIDRTLANTIASNTPDARSNPFGAITALLPPMISTPLNIIGGFLEGLFGLFSGPSEQEIPQDKTPPILSCPYVPDFTIPRGQTTVRVNIPRPTYSDNQDGAGDCQLTESPTLDGQRLLAGSYDVTFQVYDSSGNPSDTCTIRFEVKGITCKSISWPSDLASITCTPNVAGPPVWGTRCQYTCLPGYHIVGGNTRTCEHAGGSTGWLPTTSVQCEEDTCDVILAPPHGTVTCTNENKYRSICQVECDVGYLPEDPNKISAVCQAGGAWDRGNQDREYPLTTCKDFQPPVFVSCPEDVMVFAERNKETAEAFWEEPIAMDKVDNTLEVPATVLLSEGSPPGSTFTRGQHLIKYTATDVSSNEATCSFSVIVQVITCPPIRYTLKAELSCPNGYVYGSSCSFGCETGYPVVGPTSFSCERNYSNSEPVGYWDWGSSGSQPFCQIVPCPTLRPPNNGALACDGWAYGTFCLIQCNENWDVPLGTPERYVCETLSGTWDPDDDVPDCALPRDPDSMNLPSELYYYSGDCRDPETQVQIQENFIAILNSSDYSDICQLFVECAAENVQVICGNVTTRSGQPSFQLQVTFDLTVKIKQQTDQHASYFEVEDTLFAMANKIDERVKGGNFSLDNVTAIDLEVQPDSFVTDDWTNLVCGPGYMPNYDSYMCEGCIKGSYLDKDSCKKCETGLFQDEDGQTACKPCPSSTWTVKKGSRGIEQCLGICQPGWYSDTGLEPCAQCEMGHYQSMTGKKECGRCPSGQTTMILGAKAMDECVGNDLVFNTSSRVQLKGTPSDLQGLTVSFWIRPQVNTSDGSILYLQSESNTLFAVRKPDNLELTLPSASVFRTGISLNDGKWHNFVVTARHMEQDCKVYVDGAESWSQQLPNDTATVFPANMQIVIGNNGGGSFAGDITAFGLWNGTKPESTLLQMSQSCYFDDSDAIITWADVLKSTGEDIKQRIPSTCDDHNDCNPSPCGGHAIACQDQIGSYRCVCEIGFTGVHCEVNINDCHDGSCRNGGTCVDGIANYTCVCPDGFNGKLCEKGIVNGGWGEWTDWTPCSATCGNGTHQRWRQCNNPPPKEDGKNCAGPSTNSGTCRIMDCPSCLELKPPSGVIMDCYRNDTEDKEYCHIDCGPGMEFSKPPLPLYTCGPESQYKWNHQTQNNPKAILPACAHGHIPKAFSLDYEMEYPDLYCTSPEESQRVVEAIKNKGSQNVQDVDCVRKKTCNVTLEVHNCGTYEKSILPASLGLEIRGEVSGTFDVESIDENGNITNEGLETLSNLSETIVDLASAAEEIKNKSTSNDFAVVIDGQSFELDANGSKPRLIPDCQPGMIIQRMICVYCAPGTYYQDRTCVRCPKGTFQDQEGQMSCVSCPEGFTTAGVGSNNNSDCYEEPMTTQAEQSSTMMTDGIDYSSPILSTLSASSLVPNVAGNMEENNDGSLNITTIAIAVVVSTILLTVAIGVGAFLCKRKRKRKAKIAAESSFELYRRSSSNTSDNESKPPLTPF